MIREISKINLRCPGKIFFLGEYACLTDGPALIHTVEPFYEIQLSASNVFKTNLSTGSPAYKYIEDREEIFKKIEMLWFGSRDLKIGTGSSSGEFLLAMMSYYVIQNKEPKIHELWERYRKYFEGEGVVPSGADLVAQYVGGAVVVREGKPEKIESFGTGVLFYLFFTGKKIKTFEHLKLLNSMGFPNRFIGLFPRLKGITEEGIRAFENKDWVNFGECMNFFQHRLNELKLTDSDYLNRIQWIQNIEGVMGAKGSGSQGGDCILVLVDPEKRIQFENEIDKNKKHDEKLFLPLWTTRGFSKSP